jgi:hypothetical protein
LNAPAITLAAALLGLAGAMLLVTTLMVRDVRAPRPWVAATTIVVVVVLAVALPGKLHGQLIRLDAQHDAFAATYEQQAHERCLHDMGREDLTAALAFARERIPQDATYHVATRSPSVACLMLNLFPREPVRRADFDAARDWLILDGVSPDGFDAAALRERARRVDLAVPGSPSESFVLIPPDGSGG